MNDPFPTDEREQRLERIVAYLDGELSAQESAQIETQLAADEEFRLELQRMERTWLALDELPNTPVDDNFSRTTMELVVKAADDEVKYMTAALPVQKRKQQFSRILLAIGVTLMGVLVGKLLWTNPNQELIDDLPLIQYADIYFQVPDVDFLRKLGRVLTVDDVDTADEQSSVRVTEFQRISAEDDRENWLESLPGQQRLTLRAKLNRYRALTSQQRERIESLHNEILSARDSQQLQEVLLLYEQWLQGLSSSEQFELREMPSDDRVRQIEKTIESESTNRSLQLIPEQLQKLHRAVMARREEIMEGVVGKMTSKEKRELEKQKRGDHFFSQFRRNQPQRFAEIYKLALYKTILEALPEEKREAFIALPREVQFRRVAAWMLQAEAAKRHAGRRGKRSEPTEQELESFFVESVDPKMYEKLLAMPREQMQSVLVALYKGNVSARDWTMLEDYGEREVPSFGPPRMHEGRGEPRFGPEGPRGRFRPGQERERPRPPRRPLEGREGPPQGESFFGPERGFDRERRSGDSLGFGPPPPQKESDSDASE